MADHIPLEDGTTIRVPDDFTEARRADFILVQPQGQAVEVTVMVRLPQVEEDGASQEVVGRFFMPRESYETWARGNIEGLEIWRRMGL